MFTLATFQLNTIQGAIKVFLDSVIEVSKLPFPTIQLEKGLHVIFENKKIPADTCLKIINKSFKECGFIVDSKPGPDGTYVVANPNCDESRNVVDLFLQKVQKGRDEYLNSVIKESLRPKTMSLFGFKGTFFGKSAQAQVQPVPTPSVELSRPGLVN